LEPKISCFNFQHVP